MTVAEGPDRSQSPHIGATVPAPRPPAATVALIMTPLCLSVLLSALDLTIVTPAIPAIVASFHSTAGYVWIGSGFVLASTAATPVWGSLADIWGRKPIILAALTLFLAGSLLCALAPQVDALVAGRVVQGLGASGMGTMVNVIICDTFSLRDRGLYLAITSIVWAVGSAVGPVIGGTFTTRLDWRWCFWLNLPIGAVVFVVLLLFLKVPTPHTPVLAGLKAIDWTGSLLIVGSTLMILLGLEFGDVTYPWSSATVACLLAFGTVVVGVFILNEWKLAVNPVIPLRLFVNRSSVAAYVVFSCNFYVLIGLSYYLPLYSQAVLGADPLTSGVHLVPLIVSSSLSAACTGTFIQMTGVYLPLMYVGQAMLILGAGLFINLEYGEGLAKLIIFEIITGIGIGMNMEPPLLAALAAATELDTAAVTATMGFLRSIATSIAIVLGGVIFQNRMNLNSGELLRSLEPEVAANFNGKNALASVELIAGLPVDQQTAVRVAYFRSLRAVWIMYVVVGGVSLLSNVFVRSYHLSADTTTVRLGVDRRTSEDRTMAQERAGVVELNNSAQHIARI
ncbi:MFS general substrate transporter [Coniochaeta ligniaria NRRL 30616]|uniref:MFS general substrate transporter n=1 Tax=Coniochaeta ligniaria NRRL 30616 TaxID=1408157 RepID=A0A1J7IBD4_9PEZI|nr:MFS general substrate transporter [Coniochaeta ligniaria NRRL 30616]